MQKHTTTTLLVASIYVLSFGTSLFATTTSAQFKVAARKLTNVLIDDEKHAVTFGKIEGENALGNIGPGLMLEFIRAFQEVNLERKKQKKEFVAAQPSAALRIEGKFSVVDDPDDIGTEKENRLLVLKIDLNLADGATVLTSHTVYASRSRDIIRASAVPMHLDMDAGTKSIHAEIRRELGRIQAGKSSFVVNGSRIRSNSNSPYEVEILTGSPINPEFNEFRARNPSSKTGVIPLVPISIGEVYAVRIHNRADHEISVELKIDGIDQFTFSKDRNPSTGRPRFRSWIIGPKKSFTIKGWHLTADPKSKKNLAMFQVKKYGEGASQFVDVDKSKNGVISVSIARSFANRSGARSSAETGFGPPVEQKQRAVKRFIDPPHDFLSIQYAR